MKFKWWYGWFIMGVAILSIAIIDGVYDPDFWTPLFGVQSVVYFFFAIKSAEEDK